MVGSWDTIVALAFAAEELVFAAQALTTDLVPREHGLGVAHRHLHELLQHQSYLPSEIGSRLRNLDALYAEWENSPATGAKRRPSVTLATMAVLSDVRDLLHVQQLSLYIPMCILHAHALSIGQIRRSRSVRARARSGLKGIR